LVGSLKRNIAASKQVEDPDGTRDFLEASLGKQNNKQYLRAVLASATALAVAAVELAS
jgi:hypothetical protein